MHNKRERSGTIMGILLPLGMVCLFAFCSLALALMGGRAYKQIQGSVDDSFGSTVAASYLRTKLGQHNRDGAVLLREEGGLQLLVLTSTVGDAEYETRIYVKDGQLLESFERADTAFEPVGGMRIALVQGCEFQLAEDGLFSAVITSEAGSVTQTSFAISEGGRL